MIDEQMKRDLLASIKQNVKQNQIIGSPNNVNQITSNSSGSLKIVPSVIKKFKLIFAQPISSAFNPFEIRCCLCQRVINYPCWYYKVCYSINHFHYFVCFDSSSSSKPSTRCYKKGV